ncbi:MAG: PAS-domain containing protein [Rhodocyclaceae bacterium]|nr:PAS-domain containing protein [Rhodocyclaceae bacterium]
MLGITLLALTLLAALLVALAWIARMRDRLAAADAVLDTYDEFSGEWCWEQDSEFRFARFRGGRLVREQVELHLMIGRTRWDSAHEVLDQAAMAAHRSLCERHEPFRDFRYGLRFADGHSRYFVASGYPLFDARGRFVGYRGLAREDTSRLQTELALRRSEQQLAAIAAGSPVPMFALDAAGRVILWNRGCEVVLGVPAQSMMGRRDAWRAFYPSARPVLANCVMNEDALASARMLYGERVGRSESIPGALEAEGFFPAMAGRDRWLAFVAAPMRNAEGRIVGAIETLQDVTERRLAEAAAGDRSITLRALVDNMPSGISLIDSGGQVVIWNQAFLRLLDLPSSLFEDGPVPLESVFRFNARRGEYGPGDPDEIVARLQKTVERNEAHVLERVRPDGTVLEIRGTPIPGGGFVTIYTDVSARKAAEASLRIKSAYLAAVIDHLPQGISVFDQHLRLKHWNARFGEILNLPGSVLHADARFEDIIRIPAERGEYGEGDPEAQIRARHQLAMRFEPHRLERVREGGKAHLVEGRPMFVDGRIAGFVTTYTDITEHRRSEALLERQHADLESAQRIGHIGSWHWPMGAHQPECSTEMLRLLRADATQPRRGLRQLLMRVERQDRRPLVQAIRQLVDDARRIDLVCRIGRGGAAHMRLIAEARRNAEGTIVGYAGIVQDITELRTAEEALRSSGTMLSTIFEQGPVPLALIQLEDETVGMANRAWRQVFAPELADPVGQALAALGIWRDKGDWPRLRTQLRETGRVEHVEATLLRNDGREAVCEISGRSVRVDGADLLLASFVDVSEERRIRSEIEALNAHLEERVQERTGDLAAANDHLARAMSKLVQSEKLASLGGLVAGIAHELNTPLGNAVTVVGALKDKVAKFERDNAEGGMRRSTLNAFVTACIEASNLLERNVDRAARQVAHFKQVAVDQTSERRRRFDLAETVEEVVSALSPRLRLCPHTVEIDIPAGIEMDSFPGPLEQVIGNLVENALNHAFADGQAGTVRISARVAANDTVELSVRDDGLGMGPDVAEHAFDPFYTTRLGSGGSGLGLYIAYTLVAGLLGGSIGLETQPAAGCNFHMELPRVVPGIPAGPSDPEEAG